MSNLLFSRRFYPLLVTQFLGALNDNLFKNALLTYVAINLTAQSAFLANLIAGLFILPFFLFSAMAGEVADKFSRDGLARLLKAVEPVLMIGVAVAYGLHNLPLLIVLMTLMGAQSAFFGPVKYALLPQQLQTAELIAGNAYVEASTYGAILAGLILGTLLPMPMTVLLLIVFAFGGLLSARKIMSAPAPRPQMALHLNPLTALADNYRFLKKHRMLRQSIVGATWFWCIGAFAAVQIYPLCGKIISAGNGTITFFLILFSLGVAVGSYACNRLLKGVINMVYLPLSALGMAVCLLVLWRLGTDYPTADHLLGWTEFLRAPRAFGFSVALFMLAFFGGLYVIPLNAFMQKRAPRAYVATVIAGNNIFNSLGMVAVAVLSIVLLALGFSLPQLFGIMGLIGLVVSVYICALLPDYLLRSVLQTLLRILFKVRVRGSENFYRSGRKVVLIANHVSLLDGVLMAAFMPERLTFAITSAWTQRWFMPIVRLLADFYPLDPSSPLSLRKLIELIKSGRKVMIFPEGRITVTGKVMQVYDGAALTALKSGAKILPVRIDGAEYSTLSYVTDKLKCRAFPTVTLSIGEAFRPDCKEKHGRHGLWLYHLMNETAVKTAEIPTGLYRALEGRRAMIGNNQVILRTADGSSLTLKQLLKHAKRLAETMRKPLAGMSTIGLFEENPLTFVVCLTALDYLGKTIVLYDVAHVAEQVQSKRADCVIGTTPTDALQDVFYPLPRLTLKAVFASNRPSAESAKIVVFKNGQVQTYTMRQLLSGVRQLETVLAPTRQNKIVNTVAPYGTDNLVSGVLLPLLNGAELQFTAHLSPRLISHVCYDMSADVLIGTPQMLAQIQNEASQFDFFSLKYAFAVGDNVSDALAEGWLKAFGVRIMTQLTPVASIVPIAVNTPFYYRFGTFGQVLPLARADNLVRDADGFVLGINSSAASEDR